MPTTNGRKAEMQQKSPLSIQDLMDYSSTIKIFNTWQSFKVDMPWCLLSNSVVFMNQTVGLTKFNEYYASGPIPKGHLFLHWSLPVAGSIYIALAFWSLKFITQK